MAIMRHLARQLSLSRATGLTQAEKRRRNLTQALIIFPLPIVQVALTYFLMEYRYGIMPLRGCELFVSVNSLSIVSFLMVPVLCVGALFYAGMSACLFPPLWYTRA
jgi:pheromone a factor receptor